MSISHIGYIGMGIMGSAMAANLLKAGLRVTVYNRTRAKCEPLERLGANVALSPAAVVEAGVEILFTNVTDTPDVETVLFGTAGVVHAKSRNPHLLIVDHSTIHPGRTQEFSSRLAALGIGMLDAPVSGGDVGARNATLSISVGGESVAFERALPVLKHVGKTIVHVGPSGMGQVCKACNQIAVSANLIGLCEAMALAKNSGLDHTKMLQVLGGGAAGSWQLSNLGPRIAAGDFAPGFMIDLMRKDLHMVESAAADAGLELKSLAVSKTYFDASASAGDGKLGTQGVSKIVK
jgi:3-hydroxyisobutyrate dehydrogenase